ncbi:hypothetical protein T440DRAFT_216546 [Plenodomus tracheiphilus IPT5]|uniref:Uncharacterized protein n=1 Tax=Plenodomus tracheiphilus IPT5 TaxID=1408161 RepID=A0A6A7AVC6_9PLEO|nr:hypothetical protein T440DRAFT_216546 [Plenodomus tracheiphilus IPT5]
MGVIVIWSQPPHPLRSGNGYFPGGRVESISPLRYDNDRIVSVACRETRLVICLCDDPLSLCQVASPCTRVPGLKRRMSKLQVQPPAPTPRHPISPRSPQNVYATEAHASKQRVSFTGQYTRCSGSPMPACRWCAPDSRPDICTCEGSVGDAGSLYLLFAASRAAYLGVTAGVAR